MTPSASPTQCPTAVLTSSTSNQALPSTPTIPSNSTAANSTELSKPVVVMYVSDWILPPVSELGNVTHVIVSFWTLNGTAGAALHWVSNSSATAEYDQAGIIVMIAAFGSTDFPTTDDKIAEDLASNLASFTLTYAFAGVDVDYEDVDALEAGTAIDWLIKFHTKLRELLPRHIITHAPLASWFVGGKYKGGGYAELHQTIGDTVDWYNIQFYNQPGAYETCEALLQKSGGQFAGSSLFEIHNSAEIPLAKLGIGRLAMPEDGVVGGYMAPEDLNPCVKEASRAGWPIRLAAWKWHEGVQFFEKVLEGVT